MSCYRVITLEHDYTFAEALAALLAGKCLGIRPGANTNYVELFKPAWMNQDSPDHVLRWKGSISDVGVRTNQFLGPWRLVVIDHRDIAKGAKQ